MAGVISIVDLTVLLHS